MPRRTPVFLAIEPTFKFIGSCRHVKGPDTCLRSRKSVVISYFNSTRRKAVCQKQVRSLAIAAGRLAAKN